MKKALLIWMIVLVLIVVVVATTTVSLAIWQRNDHENTYIRTPIVDENPSLKYQMYVPVKASGNTTTTSTSAYERIAGIFNVSADTYSYILTDDSQLSAITGFSLAGWFGGVAFDELHVPSEVTVTVNGHQITKPVVRISAESDYGAYTFGGVNTAIKNIIIEGNVKEVRRGAFYGMAYLETVLLKSGANPVYLYPYCFGGCPNLYSIDNKRATPQGWDTSLIQAGSGPIQ